MDKGNELPKRKRLRWEGFDYSTPGGYFITICTKDRKPIFGPVGADSISASLVERTFLETINQYRNVECPIYVVMPNHFHAIIVILDQDAISRADMESAPTGAGMARADMESAPTGAGMARADMESAPTVSEIVQAFKRYSTIEYINLVKKGILPPFDKQIWQRSFYDHVIRNRDDFEQTAKYIYENPMRWYYDELYSDE